MQKTFDCSIHNSHLIIKNVSDVPLHDIFVVLKNIFYHSIIERTISILPNEKCEINIPSIISFYDTWIDKPFTITIYKNRKEIYSSTINCNDDRKIILISNEPFENLTNCLIDGLTKYSTSKIIHYNVNYNSKINHPNVTNVYFKYTNDNFDFTNPFKFLLLKSSVLLQSLKDGIHNAVFLDSDIQVKSNINRLINYNPPINNMLVMQKSAWDYVINKGEYIPGKKLREFFGFDIENPKQLFPHGMTNIMIYNKSHIDLFEEWTNICMNPKILQLLNTEYIHDELLLNCILWKHNITSNLNWFHLNIKSIKDVLFYYYSINKDNLSFLNLQNYNLGFPNQSYIPRNKQDICAFHCIKNVDIAGKINNIIYNEEIVKQQNNNQELFFKNKLISFYNNIHKLENRILKKKELPLQITTNLIDGPFASLRNGPVDKTYTCNFIDDKTNSILSSVKMKTNHWARSYQKYYKNWKIQILDDQNNIIYNEKIDLSNKKVLIWYDSSSLGDNIAWIPYIDEFRKVHNCKVTVSTFYNDLFKNEYKELEFVPPGSIVNDIIASFRIGCFGNTSEGRALLPSAWNTIPLQQICSDILGLDYKEIKPKITPYDKRLIKSKYICIGTESTAQAKLWNNIDGWQKTVDYLFKLGYEVVSLRRTGSSNLNNVLELSNKPLDETIKYLSHCELFIGLGSGLSWVAHALNKKVVLISGFSEPWCEFTTPYRVINKNVCNGCFNDATVGLFDKSWEWCPRKKNYECTKEITFEMVKSKIDDALFR